MCTLLYYILKMSLKEQFSLIIKIKIEIKHNFSLHKKYGRKYDAYLKFLK